MSNLTHLKVGSGSEKIIPDPLGWTNICTKSFLEKLGNQNQREKELISKFMASGSGFESVFPLRIRIRESQINADRIRNTA
jgi:hypothetical protein